MKNKFFNIALASILFAVTSIANAGVITLNDSTEVSVLSLEESFEAFYGYNGRQATTGFEEADTVVVFLAEYEGRLGLVTLIDAPVGSRTQRYIDFTLEGFNIDNVIVLDDPATHAIPDRPLVNGNGISFSWNTTSTDGLIYGIDDADNFDLNIAFSSTNNSTISNFKYLSFESGSTNPLEITIDSEFSLQSADNPQPPVTDIPEPTTIAMFALALFGLVSRRIKQ